MSGILLFAPASNRQLGREVAQHLGISLSPLEEREFEDGEHMTRSQVSVRGEDVYVVQSLYGEPGLSVNDKLVRLLFFIGGLVDASAERVTAVLPYLCYARKEQKTQARDPVITRYLAGLLEAVGTHRVVAMDVHNIAAFQNAHRCRTDHLEAIPLFVEHFAGELDGCSAAVVSPDPGGVKRAERLRRHLEPALKQELPLAFMEKHRARGVVRSGALAGEVAGRTAIVIDDMISTGSTILHAARACRQHGALRVIAAASHGLFTAGAESVLADPAIDQVVVTDSVGAFRLSGSGAVRTKLVVLKTAPLLASAIGAIHRGASLSALFEG